MANRVDRIIQRVDSRLTDAGKGRTRNAILTEVQSVYEEICDLYKALKLTPTIAMEVGKETYQLDPSIAKVRKFLTPDTWRRPLEVVENPDEWESITKHSMLHPLPPQPIRAFVWNGSLSIWPAPTEADTLTLLAYGNPTTALALGADPVTNPRWDYVMVLGTTARFTGDKDLSAEYEARAENAKWETWKETYAGTMRRKHWSDIGF
jgi:hypothetical protein